MPEREYEGFTPDPEGFTPDPPASSSSWTDDIFTIPNALRFGGSALGTVAGGLATGGLGAGAGMFAGGAAGEAAARWWEGKDFDPSITALEGALNLLPGGGAIPGKGAALKQVGKYALRQAGHGAWQGAAGSLPRHQAEAGNLWNPSEWEMPSAREIGTQTVAGGVIGGATGGTLGAASSRFGKAARPKLDIEPSGVNVPESDFIPQPPPLPRQPTPVRGIREGESIGDYLTTHDDDPFASSVLNEPSQAPVQTAAPITPQPQAAFDPNSLTGLQRAEVEFVDPNTGEVRSSADARPGDVPVTNEPKAAAPPTTPSTLTGWMDELIRNESGTFDPGEMGRNLRRTLLGEGGEPATKSPAADAFAETPGAAARAARVDPNVVMPSVRTQIDAMGDEYVQRLIDDFEGNPTAYGESGRNAALYGRDVLDERAAERAANPQATPATAPRQEFVDRQPDVLPRSYSQVGMVDSATPDLSNPPTAQAPAQRPSTPNTIINGISGYTRREIDGRSDSELLDFIRRHTDAYQRSANPSGDISRGLAEYATSVAESRGLNVPRARSAESPEYLEDDLSPLPAPPNEPVQIPRGRFDVEPTTSHTGGEDDFVFGPDLELDLPPHEQTILNRINEDTDAQIADRSRPANQRILDIANEARGMTPAEVRREFSNRSTEFRRGDAAPLIRELQRNPTDGTRALIDAIESIFPDLDATAPRSAGELPVKPPVEVTPEMRERSRKRLAAIGGAERAEKLISGEAVVGSTEVAPYRPRTRRGRPNTAEKISPETAAHWNEWGDRQIANYVQSDSSKPGMAIQPADQMFPKHLKIHYRDAQGNPIGYLESDYAGHGITTLAVSSKLGLRRGKIAFAMLKEAMDRGITEPSGVTSDWTKNLIDRVKSLVRGEEGSLDMDAMIKSLNEIMSGIKASKFGQSVGKAISKFGKSVSPPEPGAKRSIRDILGLDEKMGRRDFFRTVSGSVEKSRANLAKMFGKKFHHIIYEDLRSKDAFNRSVSTDEYVKMVEEAWESAANSSPEMRALKDVIDRGYTGTHMGWLDKLSDSERGLPDTGIDTGTGIIGRIAEELKGRLGSAVEEGKRLLTDESGSANIDRLNELFQKKQAGTITPEELAEARTIAQEAKAAPAAETPAPAKTGQVTWSDTRKKKPAAATTTPAPAPEPALALPRAASLPAELAGAKPRFNIGADSYSPSFADDLDKALFIIAQKTKSKSDAKYLQFVMEQTGMDEQSARLAAQGVRNTIKNQISGQEPGVVRIESIWRKNQEPAANAAPKATPKVTTQEAGTGTVAKAANEKPAAVAATPEQAVTVAMEAEQAAASLANRLKRAVENPNPANSAQEIEELLDEAAESINKIPEKDRAGWIRKVLGGNKALLTAWDLSAPGRQGKAFILNKAWWTSLNSMRKAWGSDKAANTVMQSIINHPSGYFKPGPPDKFGRPTKSYAEKMGLDLAGVEEVFGTNRGSAFDKYSGVARSSRAHTAFLNKLRSDQFVAMVQSAEKLGLGPKNDFNQVKTYAKFINDATGRGSLNVGKWKLERNLGAINDVMFAPKNLSGQIRTWNAVLNPMKYASYDPVMRNQALRSLFAIAGTGLAVGELSRLMGGKIVDDPTSSDFRKIRVGDTRIDLFGGYQQFPVAAMKFLMNAETPTSGRNAGRRIDFEQGGAFRNRATVAERFFTNRLSPAGSFVWAWMNNREFDGKPFEVKRALYERTAPIVLKDLYELAKDDPALAAIMTPSNVLGLTGTQTYGRN